MNPTGGSSSCLVCALCERPVYLPWFVMFVDPGVERVLSAFYNDTLFYYGVGIII